MEEEVKKILCKNGFKITDIKRGSFNDINLYRDYYFRYNGE